MRRSTTSSNGTTAPRTTSKSASTSEYRYNPLHNDLDAYALAYNIASLLNNLFGRGKEPFWQQAYTNLVKFIILLHKVAFDYVTLFDVYECAINPELLESRIKEAERRLIEADSALLWEEEYLKYPKDLEPFPLPARLRNPTVTARPSHQVSPPC